MKKTALSFTAVISIGALIAIAYLLQSDGEVTTVFLVRHTEKATTPPDDPPLSPEGVIRAQTLAHVLKDVDIDVVIATQFQRTQATVAPTAARADLTPVVMPAMNIQAFVDSIKSEYQGKEILIAGHSNTVPAIIQALGISNRPEITEDDYDDLFIVHLNDGRSGSVKLTHLSYGSPTP